MLKHLLSAAFAPASARMGTGFAVVCFAAASLVAPSAWAQGLPALERFIKTAQSGSAAFEQVVTSPAAQGAVRKKTSRGSFDFVRPGKFKFTYIQPFEQVLLADGKTLWLYDMDLQQATERRQDAALNGTPAAIVAQAASLKELEKTFTLADEGLVDGLAWAKATPKQKDTGFVQLRIGLTQQSDAVHLARLEISDAFGQLSQLTFKDHKANPSFGANYFSFKAPAGVTVSKH